MYDNRYGDSPASPIPNRRDINPDFSETAQLHRCDIFDRRRRRRLGSLGFCRPVAVMSPEDCSPGF